MIIKKRIRGLALGYCTPQTPQYNAVFTSPSGCWFVHAGHQQRDADADSGPRRHVVEVVSAPRSMLSVVEIGS